jgi:hypothetical protein
VKLLAPESDAIGIGEDLARLPQRTRAPPPTTWTSKPMPTQGTIVVMHLPGGPVPVGQLRMTSEPPASFATFA